MTQQQWESMSEEEQTAHCVAMTREWLAAELPALSGSGSTVVSGSHISQTEEATE